MASGGFRIKGKINGRWENPEPAGAARGEEGIEKTTRIKSGSRSTQKSSSKEKKGSDR